MMEQGRGVCGTRLGPIILCCRRRSQLRLGGDKKISRTIYVFWIALLSLPYTVVAGSAQGQKIYHKLVAAAPDKNPRSQLREADTRAEFARVDATRAAAKIGSQERGEAAQ